MERHVNLFKGQFDRIDQGPSKVQMSSTVIVNGTMPGLEISLIKVP